MSSSDGLTIPSCQVPWAFVRDSRNASGAYGNAMAPDAELRPLFARYVTEVV
jgi:hypothetical protein